MVGKLLIDIKQDFIPHTKMPRGATIGCSINEKQNITLKDISFVQKVQNIYLI